MNPTLEIFSQGEEIINGQTVDSNAAWLSEQAVQLGFNVSRHTAVGDKIEDLIAVLKEISARSDCCLCTGGLGPTCDDLTAEAVASAFDLPLQFDRIAFEQMERFFRARKRSMPDINRKQAMLPEGSLRLDNDWGTAPGFALHAGRCWFAFMPGVPSEMRQIFIARIQPLLAARFILKPSRLVTIKTLGIGESDIQQRIEHVEIPEQVRLGFRAGVDDVQTKLLFPSDYPDPSMAELTADIAGHLGEFVFGIDGLDQEIGNLASVVDHLMTQAGKTLALVETASQGLMAAKCLGYAWLLSASYEPLATLAQRWPGTVEPNDLPAIAVRLANDLKGRNGADFILVQLYDGSLEQFRDKDQAIVLHTALLTEHAFQQNRQILAGSPERKQNQAALLGLDALRRHLQKQI